ncbi:MAG: hypothetical protein HOH43_09360 [Candidatus Latescibacteria bacterium]|jgi:uncharacterized protein YjiK|nr:hypothetical protein [Candidatus Latescibacterota bacterium]
MLQILLFLIVSLFAVACSRELPTTELKLVRSYYLNGISEPSGLTMFEDVLYTVSDKDSDIIYRIDLTDSTGNALPHITFDSPQLRSGVGLDFEGITCDSDGNFYVASESALRVIYVSVNGDSVAWATASVKKAGENQGLFKTPNANLEGIALMGQRRLLLAAERQPRGLIEVDMRGERFTYNVYKYGDSSALLPEGRSPDFTGIYTDNESVWALNRNSDAVTRISFGEADLVEHERWSFSAAVNTPELKYENMRFGMAEGIHMDADQIYIILDNNGIARFQDRNDARPILLVFERPR